MTQRDEMDSIFRVLEEEIRSAGDRDMAVPDIMRGTVPALSQTTREGIKRYITSYRDWMELANELLDLDESSDEELLARLVAMKGVLNIARYYIERLAASVARDRDVPWETRVAVDLMLTAFGEQLGA